MLRTIIKQTFYLTPTVTSPVLERAKHTTCQRFKTKSQAANDLASDDTGKHPHNIEEVCVQDKCETIRCPQLCDTLESWQTKGFLTHDPIPGKFSVFIRNVDTNGKPESQYYTENHDTSKKVDATKVATYLKNKEVIPHPKGDTYLKDPNVTNKIDP